MDVFLIFLLVLNVSLSPVTSLPKTTNRIVGGSLTSSEEFPFMVSLHRKYGGHICGATIIASLWTMTAAHCLLHDTNVTFFSAEELRMVRGADGMDCRMSYITRRKTEERDVYGVYVHSLFIFSIVLNDIALVKVREPWDRSAKHVPMMLSQWSEVNQFVRHSCTVVGWGSTNAAGCTGNVVNKIYARLKMARKDIIDMEECRRMVAATIMVVDFQNLCTYNNGSNNCQGGTGGPLLCNETQVGIVSWGQGCAHVDSPSVHVRVDYHLDWIDFIMMKNGQAAGHAASTLALPLASLLLVAVR
ncbi:plasminogen-like [Bacillus rossius redtenbacheri]|uniref:plasminogen-like n=1 Tax=Bacillus rossius redtenbacheri TaxID=93214 RepID=UPI002FDEF19F